MISGLFRWAQRRLGIISGGFLWLVWTLTIIPLFVLYWEFGDYNLESCGNEAEYYAKLYSHFFLYPITLGFLSTCFLTHPFVQCVRYLFSSTEPIKPIKKVTRTAIVGIPLVVIIFAGVAEFSSSNEAIWAFSPQTSRDHHKCMGARSLLNERCEDISYKGSNSKVDSKSEKINYHQFGEHLEALGKVGIKKSWTVVAYSVGFVAMSTLFALLFMTILVTIIFQAELGKMLRLLVPALFSATFWVLFRITFLSEKMSLYEVDPLLPLNYLIFLTFMVVYIHVAIYIWTKSTPHERGINVITSILGIVPGILSFLENIGYETSFTLEPTIWLAFIGSRSSISIYFGIALFLVVVFIPHILHPLQENSKKDNPISIKSDTS